MKEFEGIYAKRKLSFGLRKVGGPKEIETSEALRKFPYGSEVYVYLVGIKKCNGPPTFIDITGETAVVQTTRGRSLFRST